MKNAHKTLPSGIIAERYRIIGTDHFEYRALRPTTDGQYQGYSSFSRVGGVLCGTVGTESLPADLDALPAYSQERSAAVKAWHDDRYAEAIEAILEAFPEAAEGTRSANGISLTVPQALIDLGREIALAIEQDDRVRLETLCLRGKVYSKIKRAALLGGVSAERLEEALSSPSKAAAAVAGFDPARHAEGVYKGRRFTHARIRDERDLSRGQECVVTRLARGYVYYKTIHGADAQGQLILAGGGCFPVEQWSRWAVS